MIAERYITEWSKSFPWTKNSFVEQDMVISRALVDIFRRCRTTLAQRCDI